MDVKDPRIFGIGLPRTGTASLAVALLALGYRTAHCVFDPRLFALGQAFVDTPVYADYRELDHQFPGSKFILTTRRFEPWLGSVQRALGFRLAYLATPAANMLFDALDRRCWIQVFGTLALEPEHYRERVAQHERAARDWFAQRPDDLLELDLEAGSDAWPRLAGFLGRPVPSVPFPYLNRNTAEDWWNLAHPLKLPSML